jgi:uncharacterized integral membrane protein
MTVGDDPGAPSAPRGSTGALPVDGRPTDVVTAEPAPTDTGVGPQPSSAPVDHTRISASWTALVAAVLVFIVLIIFIAQNTQRSTVNFLVFHGHAPTAVILLIAAVGGAAIVVIAGVARIIQLRRMARHANDPT